MAVLLITVGGVIVAGTLVDVAWTTIAAGSGGGPLTSRVARRSWQLALAAFRRTGRHSVLAVAGVAIVFIVLATWVLLVLAGWTLVFSATDGAVRATSTGTPGDLSDRLYFAGYTVFTLGNGDFRPGSGTWQLATVLATGSGLIFVTLSITYLVPVASAVAERRQLSSTISSLGSNPADILVRSWNGRDFGMLDHQLIALTTLIQMARQHHYTYPVLHYFHSLERENAAAPNLVCLNDALLLLDHGVTPGVRPDAGTRRSLNQTIVAFLETLDAAYLHTEADPLPPPSLEGLDDAGIPVVAEEEFAAAAGRDPRRRRLLAGLLADDGWYEDRR